MILVILEFSPEIFMGNMGLSGLFMNNINTLVNMEKYSPIRLHANQETGQHMSMSIFTVAELKLFYFNL